MHLRTKGDLLDAVRTAATDTEIRDYIDRGFVTNWGRFKGGFVFTADPHPAPSRKKSRIVFGARLIDGPPPRLVVGRLSGVPWADYVGGLDGLTMGDRPDQALIRKLRDQKFKGGDRKRDKHAEQKPLHPHHIVGEAQQ